MYQRFKREMSKMLKEKMMKKLMMIALLIPLSSVANEGFKYKFCYCQWNDDFEVAQLCAIMYNGSKKVIAGPYQGMGNCNADLNTLQGCEDKR